MTTPRFPPPWPVHGRVGMTVERAKIDRVWRTNTKDPSALKQGASARQMPAT